MPRGYFSLRLDTSVSGLCFCFSNRYLGELTAAFCWTRSICILTICGVLPSVIERPLTCGPAVSVFICIFGEIHVSFIKLASQQPTRFGMGSAMYLRRTLQTQKNRYLFLLIVFPDNLLKSCMGPALHSCGNLVLTIPCQINFSIVICSSCTLGSLRLAL